MMITKAEYLKAKETVEEYEHQEFQHHSLEAMYCAECQALEAHDCFCDEVHICGFCQAEDDRHFPGCQFYVDPMDYTI